MADLRQKKHLFFDLDDTLWDFEINSAKVLRELYSEHDLQARLKADFETFLPQYRKVTKDMWRRFGLREISKEYLRSRRFSETFSHFSFEDEALNNVLTNSYLDRTPKETCLKEGCHEVLGYLKQKYSLHIITNGFNDVQSIKIDGGGLRAYFDFIIMSEDYPFSKPDEEIFRLAENLSGAKASECVMIGDSYENDILGATRAGWEALYFTKSPEKDHKGKVISSLRELMDIF